MTTPLNLSDTREYNYFDNIEELSKYPDCSLYEIVAQSVQKHPNKTAYIYLEHECSYSNFLKQIDDVAKSFKKLNVNKGDKVTICMPNTPEAIIAFYALNKIGAIANMVHPLSAQNEIKYYLQISESVALLLIDYDFDLFKVISSETDVENIIVAKENEYTDKEDEDAFIEHKHIMHWKDFIKAGKSIDYETNEYTDGSQIAAILYTSGSNGMPKGVVLTNSNFNSSTVSIKHSIKVNETDKILSILPIFHGFSLRNCIHLVYLIGATNILIPRFKASDFHLLFEKYKPTVVSGVPTLWKAMIQNKNMDSIDLSFLKIAISGGDTLPANMKNEIDEFLKNHGANIQIRPGYGLTESLSGACMVPKEGYKNESVGIPHPGFNIKIVKEGTSETLPIGEVGEICISAPGVMLEYLKDPEETYKVLKYDENGVKWLYSGDLGYIDDEGWIYFKSRMGRVIISSGYNIYPQYLENILIGHPEVNDVAVIGIPHPYKIQVPKAFIVLNKGVKPNDELKNSINKHCIKNLAKFTRPYEFEYLEKLPKTTTNKIDYKKLEEYTLKK